MKSYNVVNQSPQIELYGKQRQRRHTTGAGARAVPGKEPKGLGTLNSTAHSRHYSDSLLVPNGESITSKKDASISVLTDPYTHIP